MMSMLFHHRHTYVVNRSPDQVATRLKQIVTRRWEDYSVDLVGRLNDEGNFSLRSKWPLVNVQWIDNNPGRIQGMLVQSSSGTQIKIVTTPNQVLVGCFYATLILLFFEIFGLENVVPLSQKFKIAFLATLIAVS